MHAGRTQGGKPRQSKKKEAKGRKSKATATNGVAGTHLDWAGDVPYSALSHKDILVYVISTVVHLVTVRRYFCLSLR